MKKAIVLSGGGAKGAYEIGVWKALKKLHIKYDIVTGTSVGALNGALMTQKTFMKAYLLWQKIDFSLLFKKDELTEYNKNKTARNIVKMYAKNIVKGGMDVDELEKLVRAYLDPKKIKKSKIDFAIITVNSKTMRPKVINKNDVDLTKLCDYLIASASCYPFFKKKDIETNKFIDGGFYDNMPINLAINMGAEEIIAVDLKAVGIKRLTKNKKIPITYIAPRNNIGNFLVFDKVQAMDAICYGYNDTMKVFDKFEGDIFTFKKGNLEKNYHKNIDEFKNTIDIFFTNNKDTSLAEELLEILSHKRISKIKDKVGRKTINETVEYLGKILDLEEHKVYSIRSLHKEIKQKMSTVLPTSRKNLKSRTIPHSKEITKYFYEHIPTSTENSKLKSELYAFSIIFPKEFLAAVYLRVLDN